MNRILIAGATGLAGMATVRHFAALDDWEVLAVSRGIPPLPRGVRHISVDLTDRQSCNKAFADVTGITHVAYMALHEKGDLVGGWREREHIDTNLAMLRNLLESLDVSTLRHISILQGGKAYGAPLAEIAVPAKERWPRGDHDVFYWAQEDFLRDQKKSADWTMSILRPSVILGESTSSPMSIIAALGVYASIKKHLGEPLSFPGGGRYVTTCTDSRMIAQAVEFVSVDERAAGETFNIVNGDVFVWHDLWPALARHFDMPLADPVPMCLAETMPDYAQVWDEIVALHDLEPRTMTEIVGNSWQFADIAFGYGNSSPPHRVMSPVKLHQAGFVPCYDTEDAIVYWLNRMQERQILPR
jgi:nucleoside-diphosphate-sugar epimerase